MQTRFLTSARLATYFTVVLCVATTRLSHAEETSSTVTSAAVSAESQDTTVTNETTKPLAIDRTEELKPSDFRSTKEGTWETKWKKATFPFDELIYWWNFRPERDEAFRLYLQVGFDGGEESPWLYAGYWGRVTLELDERKEPKFEHGTLEQDQLLLKKKAAQWRFRLVSAGKRTLAKPPKLGVIVTDNNPTPEASAKAHAKKNETNPGILDVGLCMQQDSGGNYLKDRCQSAAVASAMDYFGTSVPLEMIIAHTTDPEYKSFGIWPRTINTAYEFGFDAYLDRFRDWEKVKQAISENKVILCSITMPRKDTYIDPPYPAMGGHIVVMCGMTDDGRVVVTDSARRSTGYLEQWMLPDFQKIWMRNKGGVGMVICPPADAKQKLVKNLPAFPEYAKNRKPEPEEKHEDTQTSQPLTN